MRVCSSHKRKASSDHRGRESHLHVRIAGTERIFKEEPPQGEAEHRYSRYPEQCDGLDWADSVARQCRTFFAERDEPSGSGALYRAHGFRRVGSKTAQ